MKSQVLAFLSSKRKSILYAFLVIASILLALIITKMYTLPVAEPAKKVVRIKINTAKKHTKVAVNSKMKRTQLENHNTSHKKINTATVSIIKTKKPKLNSQILKTETRATALTQKQVNSVEKSASLENTDKHLTQQTKNVLQKSTNVVTSQNISKITKTAHLSKTQHLYYTIQIMNCRKKESVNAFLASNHQLKDIKVQKVGKTKPRFRIYAGKFQTYAEAQEAKKKLVHPLYHDCFIRKIK